MSNPYEDLLGAEKQSPARGYDELVQTDRDTQRQQLRTSMAGARQYTPGDAAKALRMERSTSIPARAILPNLPEVEQRESLNAYEQLLDTSPRLARALATDSIFSAAVLEDITPLSRVENVLRPPSRPAASLKSIWSGLGTSFVMGAEQVRQGIRRQFADLVGSEDMQRDAERRTAAAQGQVQDFTPDLGGNVLAEGIYGGGASLLQALPALAAGLATGNPVLPLGLIGLQAEAQAYGKYRNRGATGGEALAGAAGEGAVEVATELLPMGFLVKNMGKVGAGRFLTGLLAREMPGEQIATIAQDAIDTAIANPDKTWQQYLDERPEAAVKTALGVLVMSGAMGALNVVGERHARRQQEIEQAQSGVKLMGDLAAIKQAAKIAERDPVTFARFIDYAAEDGPVTEVYIPARALGEALLQSGVRMEVVEAQIPGFTERYTDAIATEGDVRLSVGEFTAHFAGTPLEQHLVEELRTDPSGMSMREAQDFLQTQADQLQVDTERTLAAAQVDDAFTRSKAAVEQGVLAQLTKASRFNDTVNRAYASLMGNFYATMASRTGMTPEEFAAKYPIQITAETAPAREAANTLNLPQLLPRSKVEVRVVDAARELRDVAERMEMTPDALVAAFTAKAPRPNTSFARFWERFQPVSTAALAVAKDDARFNALDAEQRDMDGSLAQAPASDIGHKRESTTGRYVGAPERVGNSPQKLAALRKEVLQLAREGEAGRFWYENSSRAILDFVGGDRVEAEKIAALIAIYSPNATVPSNTSMALTAYYQFKAGVPIKAGFSVANVKAQALLSGGERWGGIKTNSFYQNLMVHIDPTKLEEGVATMDMWMAIAFDYGMKAVDQGPKYKFMERETQRIARELGWAPHQVQAAIWTAMKGRIDPIRPALRERELKLGIRVEFEKDGKTLDAVVKGKEADHFYLARKMGMARQFDADGIETAKYDFSDAIAERAVQISWEATPGVSTGVLPGIHGATVAQKMEYLRAITEVLNPGGKDLIADAVGLPPGRNLLGWSAWDGVVGAGAQTLVATPLEGAGGKRTFKPEAAQALRDYAIVKGYALSQEAVVWHIPVFDASKKASNGVELRAPRAFTVQEMQELYAALHAKFGTWAIAPAYTHDGARLLNFVDGLSNDAFTKGIEEVLLQLSENFGGGTVTAKTYRSEGGAVDNDWRKNPNGEGYLDEGLGGRPDLQQRARDLRARVEAVNRRFAGRYGWDQPATDDAGGGGDLGLAEAERIATQAGFGAQKLIGLPDAPMRLGDATWYVPGPFAQAHDAAREYMRRAGLPYDPPRTYVKVDKARAVRIAEEYAKMPHAPLDPTVKAAYEALAKETIEQYKAVLETGLKVEFIDIERQGDPYATSPRLATKDVIENNHLWVLPTSSGFGSDATFDPVSHPLLAPTEFEVSGKPATVNDLLRVVHDYFGHIKDGVGFRADGEENAWRSHAAMFSPLARRALTSEIRGQNSWVNFGPRGEANRTASAENTVFADQKTGLLPEWVSEDGRGDSLFQSAQDTPIQTPPVRPDGTVELVHWSSTAGITRLDPDKHGKGIAGAETKRKNADPDNWVNRTYYGVGVGHPGGYVKEPGLGAHRYTASVPAERLYDIMADPAGLRPTKDEVGGWTNAASLYEKKIRDAGYAGFWRQHESLGMVAAVFTPLEATASEDVQQGATRGALTVASTGFDGHTPILKLYDAADLSTFLHESGHFFLEVLMDLAGKPGAPQQVLDDAATFMRWAGVPDIATWKSWTLSQKRDAHELWARTFEAYLFEGKAPSTEVRTLFGRFRAWLINVYKTLTALNHKLDPEITGVFDRMIATDDTIRQAEVERNLGLMFKTAEEGQLTETEWAAYQATGEEATNEAVSKLQTQALRNMQWLSRARSGRLREAQRRVAQLRKGVEAEVRAEVQREKVYAARHFLRTGELEVGDASNAVRRALDEVAGFTPKLDRAALKEMYGIEPAALWRYIPVNMTAAEDGVHPDVVAKIFGYGSGDQMVRELVAAEPEASVVEGRTDQRMLERHGDLTVPGSLEKAVDASLANEARQRVLTAELNALARATGRPKILGKAAKAFAENVVARRRIRELSPSKFERAAQRAARNAEEQLKKGKLVEAATEKRNQLVSMYGASASRKAEADVESGLRYLRKFDNDRIRKSVDPDYVDQIDQLLERYELRPVSARESRRRTSLAKWIEAQQAMGLDPVIDDALLDDAQRRPYQDLTVEEWRGLVDGVKNIEHLGRLKTRLLTVADQRTFQAHVEAAEAAIRGNAKRPAAVQLERNQWRDRVARFKDEFFAIHRKFSSLVREMDGWKDDGVLWNLFVRPMNERGDFEAAQRAKAADALSELFKPLLKSGGLKQKMYIPEIKDSLSREGRLAVALNWGNEANRQRVMEGDKWTGAQAEAILKTLTRDEWLFVQRTWDYLETWWPQIAAKERRVSGVEPERVEPLPFARQLPDGSTVNLTGGYYPIKADPDRSGRAEAYSAAEMVKQAMQGKLARATTRRGHTKARGESGLGPVHKSLGVLFGHVDQVIHDLAWHEWLIDANRLLRPGARIDTAIREHYTPAVAKAMQRMLEDIAVGEMGAQNVFEASINHVRTGATIAGLGWNLTTSLLQPLGLTQSMVRIGPKWVAKGMWHWMRDAATMENSARVIREKSSFMATRGKTMQREINEIRNRVEKGRVTPITDSFFWMIQKMQQVADIPTWLGQYEKGMAEGLDEAKAIALADQAVLDSQGGGQIKDLAQIQRGGPLLKLWTNFYSFFNTTYNLMAESRGRTSFNRPAHVGRLATDVLLLLTVPAVLSAVLKDALKGGDDDEDKLFEKLIREQLNYVLGTVVGLRDLASFVNAKGGYTGPAGLRLFSEMFKLGKQVEQGEVDAAALKAANNVAGILFHYPAGQVQRTAQGINAWAEGETTNPLAPLVGVPYRP